MNVGYLRERKIKMDIIIGNKSFFFLICELSLNAKPENIRYAFKGRANSAPLDEFRAIKAALWD